MLSLGIKSKYHERVFLSDADRRRIFIQSARLALAVAAYRSSSSKMVRDASLDARLVVHTKPDYSPTFSHRAAAAFRVFSRRFFRADAPQAMSAANVRANSET
jgi:hypothetical protein